MRVKVREKLDLDKPINLKRLGPKDKVVAGILSQIRHTSLYKSLKRKKEEEAYVEQTKNDEMLKNYILAYLYSELSQNKTLSQYGKECSEVILSLNHKYEDSLKRILPNLYNPESEPSKDFIAFDILRVEENPDLRLAFADMPILLKAQKKVL